MHDLSNAVEAAIKYRVEQGGYEVAIYTGQGDFGKVNPSLVIHAQQGREFPQESGNWYVNVECQLRMKAAEGSLPAYRELRSDVFGLLSFDNLAEQISDEAAELTVMGIINRTFAETTDEQHWLSTLTFELYACRSDLG